MHTAQAANLFLPRVSSRYEHASVIISTNHPSDAGADTLPRRTVAAAMIDRLAPHGKVISLTEDRYRLKDRDLGRVLNDDAA